MEEKKYHCEELLDKAEDWFYTRPDWNAMLQMFILDLYMKNKGIKPDEVDW
jgi:hypothetical protein